MASKAMTVATSAAIQEIYNRSIAITGKRRDLETDDKTNLVAATNEVLDRVEKLEYWDAILKKATLEASPSACWYPICHIDCTASSSEFTLLVKYFECRGSLYDSTKAHVDGGEVVINVHGNSTAGFTCDSGSQNGHAVSATKVRLGFSDGASMIDVYLYCPANCNPLICAKYADGPSTNDITWETELVKQTTEPNPGNYYDVYFLTAFAEPETQAENIYPNINGGVYYRIDNGMCYIRGDMEFTSISVAGETICQGLPAHKDGIRVGCAASAATIQTATIETDGTLTLLKPETVSDNVMFNVAYPVATCKRYIT